MPCPCLLQSSSRPLKQFLGRHRKLVAFDGGRQSGGLRHSWSVSQLAVITMARSSAPVCLHVTACDLLMRRCSGRWMPAVLCATGYAFTCHVIGFISAAFMLLHRNLKKYLQRVTCDCRLGWLNVWDPMWCEGYIELDLGVREQVAAAPGTQQRIPPPPRACDVTGTLQRVVAEILIVLSVKEPGENWQVK